MRPDQPFTGPAFALDGAVFSPCERYRYLLWRRLGGSSLVVAFVGLNPSTATAELDDPTIRRCKGFAAAWGAGLLIMANAYGLRSTDPRGLREVEDPVGPNNDAALARVARHADLIVAAWGANADADRAARVAALFRTVGRGLHCLGTTKAGAPRHPLYLRKDAVPMPWMHGREGAR